MDTITNYLRAPFDHTMERALDITMSSAPPQKSEKLTICDRITYIVSTILYFLFSPASILLWALGLAIDTVQNACSSKSFTFLEGQGREKQGDPKSFLTWNVCMLSLGLSIPYGGVAPVSKRIAEVAKKIIDLKPDLVALQEVSRPAAEMLFEKLKSHYKYFYTRISPGSLFDSEQFIASNVRIQDPKVSRLPTEKTINRALFSFKAGSLTVLTTHLEPGYTKEDAGARKMQVDTILKVAPHSKTILMGDLNMERRSDEYNSSGLAEQFSDNYTGEPTTTDAFNSQNSDSEPRDESIDFVLTTPDLNAEVSFVEGFLDPTWASSDHHALFATI